MMPLSGNKKSNWDQRLWKTLLEIAQISICKANPALFAITMGTGGISNLFVAFPYGNGSTPMLVISLIIFFMNLFLFILFFVLLAAKYICYPDKWTSLIRNPLSSLYAGTLPMGATTLINVAVLVVHEKYKVGGKGFLYFVWAMWWLDVVIACLCAWAGVHFMFTYQNHSLESMTAMWLLPVVTLIVASSSGGILSNSLQNYSKHYALITATVSAFMVTVGLALALMILTIYLLRLIIHGLPKGGTVLSVFLPLGPTGQSGYAILLIGESYTTLFPSLSATNGSIDPHTGGTIIKILFTCVAFALWSLATMWVFYAVLAIHSALRKSLVPFRISFWGLVFPNAVYSNLTISLAKLLDSPFFRVWGAFYAVCCLLLWLSIFYRSLLELKPFYSARKNGNDTSIPVIDIYEDSQEALSEGSTAPSTPMRSYSST